MKIPTAWKFTTKERPNFVDRFWDVFDMIMDWKDNIFAAYTLGWVFCLDESM